MTSSSRKTIFVACLIFASFALANSKANCALDVIFKLEICAVVSHWLINGGNDNPVARGHCCNALKGKDVRMAADCVCIAIHGHEFEASDEQINSAITSIFSLCEIAEPVPGTYRCVIY